MRDFYVVGSNLSFPLSPPGPMNGTMYELCGQYPGAPPDGSIARITCQPQPMIVEYVYIQADLSPGSVIFDFCEVWVYGDKYSKYVDDGGAWDISVHDYMIMACMVVQCNQDKLACCNAICCVMVFTFTLTDILQFCEMS